MIKKSLKPFIIIAAVACICLFLIAVVCLHPAHKKITTIEQYQKIIEEVNKEYDASFMVPEGTEEQVLQNILAKGKTENEFRESLIAAWKLHMATQSGVVSSEGEPNTNEPMINVPLFGD